MVLTSFTCIQSKIGLYNNRSFILFYRTIEPREQGFRIPLFRDHQVIVFLLNKSSSFKLSFLYTL